MIRSPAGEVARQQRLAILLPCYNEEATIGIVLRGGDGRATASNTAITLDIVRATVVALLLVLSTTGCGLRVASNGEISSPPEKRTCPNLDFQLAQLAGSSDPLAFAARSGFAVSASGRVRVIVESSGPVNLAAFAFVEEARYADRVQGPVPIANLCALAGSPGVRLVRPVDRPDLGSP